MSLMIYRKLNLTAPWLYLSAFFDRYKEECIDQLLRISTQGELKNRVSYCLSITVYQARNV